MRYGKLGAAWVAFLDRIELLISDSSKDAW